MVTLAQKARNFFRPIFSKSAFCLALVLAVISISACDHDYRKRPFGYEKLGKISELKRPESFLSAQSLLLRYDNGGFYVMSLLCTYDLAPLKVQQQGDKQILVSPYSTSSYNQDGSIISGPTKHPLPYYELVAASGEYNGPIDTLFVKVGVEKPASWRLPVPP